MSWNVFCLEDVSGENMTSDGYHNYTYTVRYREMQ